MSIRGCLALLAAKTLGIGRGVPEVAREPVDGFRAIPGPPLAGCCRGNAGPQVMLTLAAGATKHQLVPR